MGRAMSTESITIEAGGPNQYWEEMKALYGREGVEEACLDLQARFGIDIVFLLFMRLLDRRGIFLTEAEHTEAKTTVADWQNHVVTPVRSVRQWMKPRAQTSALAAYRTRIKEVELEAELIELDLLVNWLGGRKPGPETNTPGNAARVLLGGDIDRRSIRQLLKLTE